MMCFVQIWTKCIYWNINEFIWLWHNEANIGQPNKNHSKTSTDIIIGSQISWHFNSFLIPTIYYCFFLKKMSTSISLIKSSDWSFYRNFLSDPGILSTLSFDIHRFRAKTLPQIEEEWQGVPNWNCHLHEGNRVN